MTRIGLRFEETMFGRYEILEEPGAGQERRFDFHYRVDSTSLVGTLRGDLTTATGWVEAEGLVRHGPLEGTFVLKPVVQRFIRYEFAFTADDGRRYRFEGQKALRHLHPFRTWTTLPGEIFDDRGRPWARSVSRFDLRKLPSLLVSIRPTLVEG